MHVWRKSLSKDIGNYIKSENVENNSERDMEMVPGNWTWYNRPA